MRGNTEVDGIKKVKCKYEATTMVCEENLVLV